MRESQLQKSCLRLVREHGFLPVNIHGDGWTNKGFPDLLIFGNGKVIAVELKSDSGYQIQADQIIWKKRLESQGIHHYILKSTKELSSVLEREFTNDTK